MTCCGLGGRQASGGYGLQLVAGTTEREKQMEGGVGWEEKLVGKAGFSPILDAIFFLLRS
jgi:hypothetical protein